MLQSQRGRNKEYLIGSIIAHKDPQHGRKGNVSANISRRSSTNVQHRESINVVFDGVDHCRLKAVVPKAQMNKAASTNRECSGVFITRLLPRCTPIAASISYSRYLRVHTKHEKLQTIQS